MPSTSRPPRQITPLPGPKNRPVQTIPAKRRRPTPVSQPHPAETATADHPGAAFALRAAAQQQPPPSRRTSFPPLNPVVRTWTTGYAGLTPQPPLRREPAIRWDVLSLLWLAAHGRLGT